MSVDNEHPTAIGSLVDRMFTDRDVSVRTGKGVDEFVVVSRNVSDGHALARFAQDFLNHVVMRLRPVTATAQLPDVDQIANDVEFLAVVIAQELQQRLHIAGPCAQMHIRNPDCADASNRI